MRKPLVFLFCLVCCACFALNSARGSERWGRVQKVIDGDTVMLTDGTRVRYIGIDAPEIDHKHHRAEPQAYAALSANKMLVSGRNLRFVIGNESKDRYGRLLAYIYDAQGRHINQELLEQGLAYVLYSKQNNRNWKLFLAAQRNAMRRRIGIWRHIDQKAGPVVGNTVSKRFHLATCKFGKRIRKSNIVTMKSMWEAYWNGYAPCKACLPSSVKPSTH